MKEAEKNQKMGELILELLDGNRINQMVLDIWEKAPDDVKAAIAAEVIKKVKDQIVQVDFSAAPNYMRDRDRPPHPLTVMVQSVWQEVVREAEPSLREEIRNR